MAHRFYDEGPYVGHDDAPATYSPSRGVNEAAYPMTEAANRQGYPSSRGVAQVGDAERQASGNGFMTPPKAGSSPAAQALLAHHQQQQQQPSSQQPQSYFPPSPPQQRQQQQFEQQQPRQQPYVSYAAPSLQPLPLYAAPQGGEAPSKEAASLGTEQTNNAKRAKTVVSRDTKGTKATGATTTTSAGIGSRGYWLPGRWALALFLTVVIESITVVAMVGAAFGVVWLDTRGKKVDELRTINVFFSLTIFAMIFLVLVSLDANRQKNTIQVIGVAALNVAILVTTALEIPQAHDALQYQDSEGGGAHCLDLPASMGNTRGRRCNAIDTLFPLVERLLIVVPVIVGVAQFVLAYLAWKLWAEWGWRIYKVIGADIQTRRRYLAYQVFAVFLKFDFFFGVAFAMSFLILVANSNDWEYAVTIAALPAAIIVLFLASLAAKKEIKSLMAFAIACFLAGAVYFIYKITRIYDPSTRASYQTVRLSLTFFSIFATISLLFTIVFACICLHNFGKGLRQAHESIGWGLRRRRPKHMAASSMGGQPRLSLDGASLGSDHAAQPVHGDDQAYRGNHAAHAHNLQPRANGDTFDDDDDDDDYEGTYRHTQRAGGYQHNDRGHHAQGPSTYGTTNPSRLSLD